MLNAVGRDIPDEILKRYGKEPFRGSSYRDDKKKKKKKKKDETVGF